MAKEETIQMQGEIVETLPNATFRVKLAENFVSAGDVKTFKPFDVCESPDGRFLYVSDLLQRQEFAYDQSHGPIGEAVTVEPELRWLNQRQIREQVGALGAFYGFAR